MNRCSARSIVPSPPRTTAMSASSPSTSSTPHRAATRQSVSTASPTPSRSIVTTAARLTDGMRDPPVEAGGELGVLSLDDVEDELTVSLRAWQTRVYDPARLGPAREQRLRDFEHDAPLHRRVADDALRDLGAPRLELRLD